MNTNHPLSAARRDRTAASASARGAADSRVHPAALRGDGMQAPEMPDDEPACDVVEILGEDAEAEKELEALWLLNRYTPHDKDLQQRIWESNEAIREAAAKFKDLYPEPKPVPSALGLDLNSASGRLKRSGLQIGKVTQQYSEKVPKGCIIRQVPGPGGRVNKNGAVKVVISKGPPPENEKHMTLRKKELVRGLRIKSRNDLDQNGERLSDVTAANGGEPAIII